MFIFDFSWGPNKEYSSRPGWQRKGSKNASAGKASKLNVQVLSQICGDQCWSLSCHKYQPQREITSPDGRQLLKYCNKCQWKKCRGIWFMFCYSIEPFGSLSFHALDSCCLHLDTMFTAWCGRLSRLRLTPAEYMAMTVESVDKVRHRVRFKPAGTQTDTASWNSQFTY